MIETEKEELNECEGQREHSSYYCKIEREVKILEKKETELFLKLKWVKQISSIPNLVVFS